MGRGIGDWDYRNLILGDGGETIAVKRFGDREVRVVCQEMDTDEFLIYTVMKQWVRTP